LQKSETENKIGFSNEELVDIITATLTKGASTRMKALGSSMNPFIRCGDILTISPLSKASIGVGKATAFTCVKRKRLTVHRAIKKEGNGYIIKGDNCGDPDGLVSLNNILGVITKVERDNRRIFFGLGAERFIIAFLSRRGWLPFVYRFKIFILKNTGKFIPANTRKFIKCRIHL